ncbi:uncharacterized protein LOC62_01G001215 [Vanrija pseudolonga]|uniref:Uncharacterized protein n=1 Tax=Vanrija pseudolonga TaxID=143232 RepID=A0AAF0Y0N4_9TREE|nr:hypothetical protein LOC62_01G001215 [Vanrija pseudolonga]
MAKEVAKRQPARPVPHTVHKHPEGTAAAHEERAPLPAVLLGAEDKVHEQDADGGRRQSDDEECQEEEAERVVSSVAKQAREHKVELDKRRAEGEDTANDSRRNRLEVPRDGRDLSWDRVDAHRVREATVLHAEEVACNGERQREQEPEQKDGEDGAERHGAGCLGKDKEQVEHADDRKRHNREQRGREDEVGLPGLTAEGRENARRDRKHEGDRYHADELGAVADHDREQHWAVGGTEHLAVDELPSIVLLNVLGKVDSVVAVDILGHCAVEDHGDHEGEEADNDERVDEREPVDLGVKDVKVAVPAEPPRNIALDKLDRNSFVCESDSLYGAFTKQFGVVSLLTIESTDRG